MPRYDPIRKTYDDTEMGGLLRVSPMIARLTAGSDESGQELAGRMFSG